MLTAVSLAYSVYATATDRAAAYFLTPPGSGSSGSAPSWRVAERPLVGTGPRTGRRVHGAPVVMRWAGLGAVLVSAVTLSAASPFPGYLALLPVVGTALVIAAGDAAA